MQSAQLSYLISQDKAADHIVYSWQACTIIQVLEPCYCPQWLMDFQSHVLAHTNVDEHLVGGMFFSVGRPFRIHVAIYPKLFSYESKIITLSLAQLSFVVQPSNVGPYNPLWHQVTQKSTYPSKLLKSCGKFICILVLFLK